MGPRRTETRLADGRALYYYDDERPEQHPDAPDTRDTRDLPEARNVPDTRDLPVAATTSHLRWDPLREQWVIIASHRQERTHLPPTSRCPLCPSRPGRPTEIPAPDYDVVVFENRFPSLTSASTAEGPAPVQASGGRCEVMCFTSDHDASFAGLGHRRAGTVVEAWIDRTRALSAQPGVEQVFVFENRGEEIGVTLSHPHGQIYAYPFVPAALDLMLGAARRHRDRGGGCLLCAMRGSAGRRVVTENAHWTAFVPHAARWPYEVYLCARRHLPDLPALDGAERASLAAIYLDVLRRFDALFDTPTPYVAAWMQAPAHRDRDLAHLHAQVFSIRRAKDRLKYLAGSESAAGAFINDVVPEQAAARLRG